MFPSVTNVSPIETAGRDTVTRAEPRQLFDSSDSNIVPSPSVQARTKYSPGAVELGMVTLVVPVVDVPPDWRSPTLRAPSGTDRPNGARVRYKRVTELVPVRTAPMLAVVSVTLTDWPGTAVAVDVETAVTARSEAGLFSPFSW